MKKHHYLIVVLFVFMGIAGGFYSGRYFSPKTTVHQEKPQATDPLVSATELVTEDVSDSVEIASKENININAVFGVDITIVDKSLTLLKEDCIDEVNTRKLVSGAVSGMKQKLVEKKLKADILMPIPANCPEKSLLNELHKRYAHVLALYGSKITEEELSYAALSGMMDALGDPYAAALDPKEYKLLNEFMSGGNYGGIGVYLKVEPKLNALAIVEPIQGGPAFRAGLKRDDLVLKINGEPTKGMDMEVATQKVRGVAGSTVTLLIKRGVGQPQQYSIKREIIHENSVRVSMKPGKIAYIKIGFFGEDTGKEFADAYDKILAEGAKALLLDLRNNTGGYIAASIDVCSKLLENGSLIVSVVNPRTGRHEVYRAYGGEQCPIPVVVLVNENSASASEITAGALKDTDSAVLVGTKTFGKGMVQSIREFRDGGAIKYTIAKYVTPRGDDINRKGILPNVLVNMNAELINTDADTQRDKALSLLKTKMKKTAKPAVPKTIPTPTPIEPPIPRDDFRD